MIPGKEGERWQLWLRLSDQSDAAFHRSLLAEAPTVPDNQSALRPFAHEVGENETVWVVNKRKHGRVCGPKAKHHVDSCPYRMPKEVAPKDDPVMYLAAGEHAVDPVDGVPVFVPMVPAAFQDSYTHPAPYSNGRYPV